MIQTTVNGKPQKLDVDPETPILWVLREQLGMTGAKFGCGVAQCGACTAHLDGQPIRSCSTPISEADGRQITTIEGLAGPGGALHPLQQAWIDAQVPQCGYCQSGQILAAASLIKTKPNPSDEDISREMTNICRCGTYNRIRAAIKQAAAAVRAA